MVLFPPCITASGRHGWLFLAAVGISDDVYVCSMVMPVSAMG